MADGFTDITDMDRIRAEIAEIQKELQTALQEVIQTAGKKLPKAELDEIKQEFDELNVLLDRLKSGEIWIALFGRTSVGKSALANAIIGRDEAIAGPKHDLTGKATYYIREPWKVGDIPGFMGRKLNEEVALSEARKALGHIFVVESEPFDPEIKLFDLVHAAHPDSSKIVFVNKWDKIEGESPPEDVEIVRASIIEKMSKYVRTEEDIVFGSAAIYDRTSKKMVRQDVTPLIDRLHEGAGTLGAVMNIINPTHRADDLTGRISRKILAVRLNVCRRFINIFAISSIAAGAVPFDTLLVQPGILGSLAFTLMRILGVSATRDGAKRLAKEMLWSCGRLFAVEFAAVTAADIAAGIGTVTMPFFFWAFAAADVALFSYYRYRRTALFGEMVLEFVQNDFSWGVEGPKAAFARCKERANEHYARLRPAGKSEDDTTDTISKL